MKIHTEAWRFVHVIRSLCDIPYPRVIQLFSTHGSDIREGCRVTYNDVSLAREILSLLEYPGFVQSILSHCPGFQESGGVDILMAVCSAVHSYKKGSGKPFTIYHLYTCGVFHQLVIAVLIGHSQALQKLAALCTSMQTFDASTVDASTVDGFEGVFTWTKLLWHLVRSRAFHIHVGVLAKAESLERPQKVHYEEAVKFAEEQKLRCSDRVLAARVLEGESGDVEPSEAEIAHWDVDVAFRKLASMAVTYIGAADIAERYSMKVRKSRGYAPMFRASFIALKRPEGIVTWAGIEHTMESLSFQKEHIATLKEAIDARSQQGGMAPIFNKIATLKDKGSIPWTPAYHCEAVLAVLLAGGAIEGDLELGFRIKV